MIGSEFVGLMDLELSMQACKIEFYVFFFDLLSYLVFLTAYVY